MPMWKDSKGGHAIRVPCGKVIATAYRPRRQALHKEPRTPIYKRETMHIRLATTWHMCAPDCHGALFLRTRRPSWTPSEGHAQSGCIDIGIAAGNREEYEIPQSSRSAREAGLPPARMHDRLERAAVSRPLSSLPFPAPISSGPAFPALGNRLGVAAPGPALSWTRFDGCEMRFDELETLRAPTHARTSSNCHSRPQASC